MAAPAAAPTAQSARLTPPEAQAARPSSKAQADGPSGGGSSSSTAPAPTSAVVGTACFRSQACSWSLVAGPGGAAAVAVLGEPSWAMRSEWAACMVTVTAEALHLIPAPELTCHGDGAMRPGAVFLERVLEVVQCSRQDCAPLLQQAGLVDLRELLASSQGLSPVPEVALGGSEDDQDGCAVLDAIDLGCFDLPPIPLARLPQSPAGLPTALRAAATSERRAGGGKHRGYGNDKPMEKHWGVRLGEYDRSNCQPHQGLNAPMPPLPPSSFRLPHRTHRELRSHREPGSDSAAAHAALAAAVAVAADAAPLPHLVVVRTVVLRTGSGLGPLLALCFQQEEDADAACAALLRASAAVARPPGAASSVAAAPGAGGLLPASATAAALGQPTPSEPRAAG